MQTIRQDKLVRDADLLMHRVWTAVVGTPGYNKSDWHKLERAIWALRELK